jgi:hypothetical protein
VGVHEAGSRLQDAVRGRQRRSFSTRPADQRFDGAWAGLHGRLVACTRLVDGPEAARASALLANLFPTGLEFLMLGYEAEWVHSRELLTRIAEEKHTDDLVELAGQRFVDAVHKAHQDLGKALGLEGEQKIDPSLMVGEQIVALSNAIAKYARCLRARSWTSRRSRRFELPWHRWMPTTRTTVAAARVRQRRTQRPKTPTPRPRASTSTSRCRR